MVLYDARNYRPSCKPEDFYIARAVLRYGEYGSYEPDVVYKTEYLQAYASALYRIILYLSRDRGSVFLPEYRDINDMKTLIEINAMDDVNTYDLYFSEKSDCIIKDCMFFDYGLLNSLFVLNPDEVFRVMLSGYVKKHRFYMYRASDADRKMYIGNLIRGLDVHFREIPGDVRSLCRGIREQG